MLQAKFSVLSISLVDCIVTTELARMEKEKVLNPTGVFPTKHYFHAILTHAILILTLVKQYFLHLMNSAMFLQKPVSTNPHLENLLMLKAKILQQNLN